MSATATATPVMQPFLTIPDSTDREIITKETGILFSDNNEPYLDVASTSGKFRLTPARPADASAQVEMNNDPRIYTQIQGPPLPFPLSQGERFVSSNQKRASDEYDRIVTSVKEGKDWKEVSKWFPLLILRDMEDGEKYVGEIALLNIGEKWVIGANIHPTYHRRFLASTLTSLAFTHWVHPNPHIHTVIAECFADNIASRRTWEKAGFKVDEEASGGKIERSEELGGDREEVVYKWVRE